MMFRANKNIRVVAIVDRMRHWSLPSSPDGLPRKMARAGSRGLATTFQPRFSSSHDNERQDKKISEFQLSSFTRE